MLRTETSNLSKEEQRRLHPEFLANEQAYLGMRDALLAKYRGQWVAVAGGKVLAAGTQLFDVMDRAGESTRHAYVALVGGEDEVVFRVRRVAFAYDQSYRPFPLPRVAATFFNQAETHSQHCLDVIPDTGADLSVLPHPDCVALDLFNSPCITGMAAGVVGAGTTTLFYRGKVDLEGNRMPALIQPVAVGNERILGRDVLNQLRAMFDGPAGQVIVNP